MASTRGLSYVRKPIQFFDGTPFNADDPISYLNGLQIKQDFAAADVILDPQRIAA
ncbi:MAG: hypothetical protein WBA07_16820 [Rivularia sp. (in: cyanobacteria)]